jgi:hypothetical protein
VASRRRRQPRHTTQRTSGKPPGAGPATSAARSTHPRARTGPRLGQAGDGEQRQRQRLAPGRIAIARGGCALAVQEGQRRDRRRKGHPLHLQHTAAPSPNSRMATSASRDIHEPFRCSSTLAARSGRPVPARRRTARGRPGPAERQQPGRSGVPARTRW